MIYHMLMVWVLPLAVGNHLFLCEYVYRFVGLPVFIGNWNDFPPRYCGCSIYVLWAAQVWLYVAVQVRTADGGTIGGCASGMWSKSLTFQFPLVVVVVVFKVLSQDRVQQRPVLSRSLTVPSVEAFTVFSHGWFLQRLASSSLLTFLPEFFKVFLPDMSPDSVLRSRTSTSQLPVSIPVAHGVLGAQDARIMAGMDQKDRYAASFLAHRGFLQWHVQDWYCWLDTPFPLW